MKCVYIWCLNLGAIPRVFTECFAVKYYINTWGKKIQIWSFKCTAKNYDLQEGFKSTITFTVAKVSRCCRGYVTILYKYKRKLHFLPSLYLSLKKYMTMKYSTVYLIGFIVPWDFDIIISTSIVYCYTQKPCVYFFFYFKGPKCKMLSLLKRQKRRTT